ncbi:hypothetical protein BB561_004089 [Smittium simulii]|uniref:CLASP N-terminal domain-containing protein n=1 Tax=Smittium simulii TaxID=133385 RepID=A0A2T9YI34_9FUNG|nr:hypothetical protein BB561_004813 [Smittium simulii]PVU92012.1 hypothetical protein BB561_004089 [Smittium simulii]
MDYTKCESVRDLQNKLDPIVAALSLNETEDNWLKIDNALKNLSSLLNTGASKYPAIFDAIKDNSDVISRSIVTERTRLSGSALALIETLAKSCPKEFRSLSNLFIRDIIKLCARTNKVFSTRGTNCLNAMLTHGRCFEYIPLLCDYAINDPSKILRAHISKVLLLAVQIIGTGDSQLYDILKEKEDVKNYFAIIESAIATTAVDADVNVRATAKSLYEIYTKKFPENKERLVNNLSPIAQKYLKIQSSSVSTKPLIRPGIRQNSFVGARSSIINKKIAPTLNNNQTNIQKDNPETPFNEDKSLNDSQHKLQAVRRITPVINVQAEQGSLLKPIELENDTNSISSTKNLSESANIVSGIINSVNDITVSNPLTDSNSLTTETHNNTCQTEVKDINNANNNQNSGFEHAPLVQRKLAITEKTAIAGQQTLSAVNRNLESLSYNQTIKPIKKRTYSTLEEQSDHHAQEYDTVRAKKFIKPNSTNKDFLASNSTNTTQNNLSLFKRNTALNLPHALQKKSREIRRKSIIRARQIAIIQSRNVVAKSITVRDKLIRKTDDHISKKFMKSTVTSTSATMLTSASKRPLVSKIVNNKTATAPFDKVLNNKVPIHLRTTASSRSRNSNLNKILPKRAVHNTNNLSVLNFGVQNPKSPLVKKFSKVTSQLEPKSITKPKNTPTFLRKDHLSLLSSKSNAKNNNYISSMPNNDNKNKSNLNINFISPTIKTLSHFQKKLDLKNNETKIINTIDMSKNPENEFNLTYSSPTKNQNLSLAATKPESVQYSKEPFDSIPALGVDIKNQHMDVDTTSTSKALIGIDNSSTSAVEIS